MSQGKGLWGEFAENFKEILKLEKNSEDIFFRKILELNGKCIKHA